MKFYIGAYLCGPTVYIGIPITRGYRLNTPLGSLDIRLVLFISKLKLIKNTSIREIEE